MPELSDRRLDLIQPLRGALLPIPSDRDDHCSVCAGAIYARCDRCDNASAVLGWLPRVHSIALAVEGEQLNRALVRYKASYVAEPERDIHTRLLAALISLFIEKHGRCVGEFDAVVGVSSLSRCAPAMIINRVASLRSRLISPIERIEPKSRNANRSAYRLTAPVAGMRILVVEDTFVTGASLFSAASTLSEGGAEIIGALAIGRQAKTSWPPTAETLRWLRAVPWHPDRCRVCDGATPPGSMF